MVKLPNFIQFISESDKDDKELKQYVDKKVDLCPRCGESYDKCKCETDDYWSTHTFHRISKGEEKKSKPKQEFKK